MATEPNSTPVPRRTKIGEAALADTAILFIILDVDGREQGIGTAAEIAALDAAGVLPAGYRVVPAASGGIAVPSGDDTPILAHVERLAASGEATNA